MVLAGGRGSRLKQLTDWRAKPAVPFGGKYRIIDFTLSNCVNSGIRRIGIRTQYKSHSLIRHVQRGWSFLDGRFDEYVELLPAQQRDRAPSGTAAPPTRCTRTWTSCGARAATACWCSPAITSTRWTTARCSRSTSRAGATLTVACIEVPLDEAARFGVMQRRRPTAASSAFEEKPRSRAGARQPGRALASMGIYVFDADFLYEELLRDARRSASSHDFGKDLIPRLVAAGVARPRAPLRRRAAST